MQRLVSGFKHGFCITLLFFFCLGQTAAQEESSDSIVTNLSDTLSKPKKKFAPVKWLFARDDYPNPTKALVFSLILPGSGQIYNRKYFKLPIVYGALTGLYLMADFNQSYYKRFQTAYALELDGLNHEFTGTSVDDATSLRNYRDDYRKNLETAYIFLTIAYMLNGIDAYVDAHLKNFDVSDDISLQVNPTIMIIPGLNTQPTPGLRVVLSAP